VHPRRIAIPSVLLLASVGLAPSAATADTTSALAFQKGLQLSAPFPYGLAQGEPTIRVDNTGLMYVMAPGSTPIGCELWTLPPGAQSDAFRGAPDDGAGGGDCDVAISPTTAAGQSNPTMAYSSLSLPNITVGNTTDGGASFSTPNLAASQVPGDDRQWMAWGDANTVYLDSHLLATDNIGVSASTDGGLTYAFRGFAIDAAHIAQAAYNNELGPLVVDTVSTASPQPLYTIFTAPATALENLNSAAGETADNNNAVYLASSTDGGYTWTDTPIWVGPTTETYDHIFPALAIDASGNLWAAWASAEHIYVSHAPTRGGDLDDPTSTDLSVQLLPDPTIDLSTQPAGTLAWSTPIQIDQTGATANLYPWIAGGGNGRADLVWYAGTGVSNSDPTNQWVVRFAQLHATNQGLAVDQTVASDHVIHYGEICTTGVTCGVTGNRNLLDFFTDAITPDGRAVIAWADDATSTGAQIYVTEQCSGVNARSGQQLPAVC